MLGRYPGQIDLCVTLTYYLEERFFFKARRSGRVKRAGFHFLAQTGI